MTANITLMKISSESEFVLHRLNDIWIKLRYNSKTHEIASSPILLSLYDNTGNIKNKGRENVIECNLNLGSYTIVSHI
jgi:hypothetical protein